MIETRHSEADTFEYFCGIVTAFNEAIRKRNIKGILDIGFPVAKHTIASLEFRKLQAVIGIVAIIAAGASLLGGNIDFHLPDKEP